MSHVNVSVSLMVANVTEIEKGTTTLACMCVRACVRACVCVCAKIKKTCVNKKIIFGLLSHDTCFVNVFDSFVPVFIINDSVITCDEIKNAADCISTNVSKKC